MVISYLPGEWRIARTVRDSKAVGHADGSVIIISPFGQRASRRIAIQTSFFQIADELPMVGQIERPDQRQAAIEQTAARCICAQAADRRLFSGYAVDRIRGFGIGPRRLRD